MQVFNLTKKPIEYRGKTIPANGGSVKFFNMAIVPNRDRELEKKGVLSFGQLPAWYLLKKSVR